ncbi:MAG: hypothetical protein KDA86_15900 [Planctomycetaceae bacterium]|nr:hypothetical protein [Planctomycetaceae bacterium]
MSNLLPRHGTGVNGQHVYAGRPLTQKGPGEAYCEWKLAKNEPASTS